MPGAFAFPLVIFLSLLLFGESSVVSFDNFLEISPTKFLFSSLFLFTFFIFNWPLFTQLQIVKKINSYYLAISPQNQLLIRLGVISTSSPRLLLWRCLTNFHHCLSYLMSTSDKAIYMIHFHELHFCFLIVGSTLKKPICSFHHHRAGSTDIPDPLSPLLPIVHHPR